jgi:branched-chain amino acid transport system substrate-binding protein
MSSTHRSGRGRRKAVAAACAALALTSAAACSSKSDEGSDGTAAPAATDAAPANTEEIDTTVAATDDTAPSDTASATTPDTEVDTTEAPADPLGEPNPATDTPITIGVITDGQAEFGNTEILDKAIEGSIAYSNEYLGGINGHVIETKTCATDGTPSGATQCAVDMASAGVAAVIVPVSAQDGVVLEGLTGSGIPYVTYTSANGAVLATPGAFLLTNPISQIAVPGLVAQEEGVEKVAFIIIDVPAATGPISAIATPIYANLGVDLQIVPIAPSVADMTPQIQEAISGGAGMFTITGTDEFIVSAATALDQLGFEGKIMLGNPSQAVIDGVPNPDGIGASGTSTEDPADADYQTFLAMVDQYMGGLEPDTQSAQAFSLITGFVEALTGATGAVDAAGITAALSSMPEPIDLPLSGGIPFQCGTAPVSFAPNVCSTDVLQWAYDADGQRVDFAVVDVPAEVLTLG